MAAVPAAASGLIGARRLTGLFSHALPVTLAVLSRPAKRTKPGSAFYQERSRLADVEQLGQLESWEAAKVSRCPTFGSCQPQALRIAMLHAGRDRAAGFSRLCRLGQDSALVAHCALTLCLPVVALEAQPSDARRGGICRKKPPQAW